MGEITWKNLEKTEDMDSLLERSHHSVQYIFKHSTRCPISRIVKGRIQKEGVKSVGSRKIYYLDLLTHRHISDEVSRILDVPHESPQLLLIRNGQCIYHASHFDVSLGNIPG